MEIVGVIGTIFFIEGSTHGGMKRSVSVWLVTRYARVCCAHGFFHSAHVRHVQAC